MAYRRSLSSSSNLLTRRFNPSYGYVIHGNDRKRESPNEDSSRHGINSILHGSFSGNNINTFSGFGAFGRNRSFHLFSLPSKMGIDFRRLMSSSIGSPENTEYLTDVAGVFSDTTVETMVSQAPVVNEVAIAAADSFFPVAALQYLVDGVHSFTGFNWWASIVLTTLLIRGATIPFIINQIKSTTKLTLMRPQLDEIKEEMQNKGMMDAEAIAEGKRKMHRLFKEYGVTPFTPLKGMFIQGPIFISFFLGISNMAEKVPSFKYGGAYWFTDLTTPDSLYIFPCLTALSFLITVECNMQDGLEGNPIAGTMKKFSRIVAVLTIPFTISFPKAIFCYWVTSNLFSLMFGLVIKRPEVKKLCGIPEIPPAAPSTSLQPAFSLSSVYQQYKEAVEQRASRPMEPSDDSPSSTEASADSPKMTDRKISSSSLINQRLRSLEKQVKGRKKNKPL